MLFFIVAHARDRTALLSGELGLSNLEPALSLLRFGVDSRRLPLHSLPFLVGMSLPVPPPPKVLGSTYNTAEVEIAPADNAALRFAIQMSERKNAPTALSASYTAVPLTAASSTSPWKQVYTGPAQTFTLGSLSAARTYALRMMAFIEGASSDWSELVQFQTKGQDGSRRTAASRAAVPPLSADDLHRAIDHSNRAAVTEAVEVQCVHATCAICSALHSGVSVNAPDRAGNSPVMHAAQLGSIESPRFPCTPFLHVAQDPGRAAAAARRCQLCLGQRQDGADARKLLRTSAGDGAAAGGRR